MTYAVLVMRKAQGELADFPLAVYENVKGAMKALGETPRPSGCKKLTGREGWRIRVGDYRVVYEIDDDRKVVTVLHAGHRRDVYR